MIITHLNGGLGNQMFQYAFGKRTAVKNNDILKLDISNFSKVYTVETPRQYNLHVFNIHDKFASNEEIEKTKNKSGNLFSRIKASILRNNTPNNENSLIKEKHFQFDPEMLNIRGDVYLQGYWQSEKYFKDIEDIIRKDFAIKISPEETNKNTLKKINNTESISLHIRRGDYVKDKKTNQFHGICSLDYYAKAVGIIAKKLKDPYFFVFSDDIAWAKKNLKIKFPVHFVDNNDDEHSYEDLRLMSACKHNIIANSSFSWWGAWLNKNPHKIVIAPKKWLNDRNIDTSDITPKGWLRI